MKLDSVTLCKSERMPIIVYSFSIKCEAQMTTRLGLQCWDFTCIRNRPGQPTTETPPIWAEYWKEGVNLSLHRPSNLTFLIFPTLDFLLSLLKLLFHYQFFCPTLNPFYFILLSPLIFLSLSNLLFLFSRLLLPQPNLSSSHPVNSLPLTLLFSLLP